MSPLSAQLCSLKVIIVIVYPIQVYSLDCYFRQTWSDPRLQFNTSGVGQISLDWKSLTKIWRPDTVFMNGQKCYLHKMTTPNRFIPIYKKQVHLFQWKSNRFIRFYPDGRVSYSQRLTVWARCAMHLGEEVFFVVVFCFGFCCIIHLGEDVFFVFFPV